jgi:hypothetical protein
VLDGEGNVLSADYCNCDCYKALHGISLMEKIFGRGNQLIRADEGSGTMRPEGRR